MRELCCTDIASMTIQGLLDRTGVMETAKVDGVVCGSAQGDIKAFNPARYAALGAGLPVETECHYIEMQDGSAVSSINHAAAQIALGYADILIAGGMESCSTPAIYYSTTVPPYRQIGPRPLTMHLAPTSEQDLSADKIFEQMAAKWGVCREDCDEYALRSRQRLRDACQSGLVGGEIIPYRKPAGGTSLEQVIDQDEYPRAEVTMEEMQSLPPILEGGINTAGNTAGKGDGAAFVLVMAAEKAKELGYRPYARWVAGADAGVEPRLMGIGSVFSSLKALKIAGLTLADMGVMECNEASAAQNLCVIKELEAQTGDKVDLSVWNPNGGAIALGYPAGASGAQLAIFSMKQMERSGVRYGLFSACCKGGHGVTTIIENLRR